MNIVEGIFHFKKVKTAEAAEEPTEQKAKMQLESFLDENYKLIRAMRSYNHFMEGYNTDSEQLEKLENW